MMGLVDYGSDSGSGSDDSGDEGLPSGVLVKNPTKEINAPVTEKAMAVSVEDAGFFGDDRDDREDEDDDEEGSKFSLPAVRSTNRVSGEVEEDEIDDIVKPKDWEKKLAEKARRKLEKKTLKRAEKEKKREEKRAKKEGKSEYKEEAKKKRGPVKIDAFGGLSKAVVEIEEEVEDKSEKPVTVSASSFSSLKLFSMLPAPKTASRLAPTGKAASLMMPPSLRTKTVEKTSATVVKEPLKSLVSGMDSSSDEEGDGDFFGLSSTQSTVAPIPINHIPGVPLLPSYGLSDAAGPARPDPMDSSHGYEDADEEEEDEGPTSSGQMKTISDEAAQNMIFKYDYAPFGHDRRGFSDADIIDVSVDRAIGPNVQENLLKNLNRHNMARASMPSLPSAAAPNDKNAKRKHQITYLANIAVAREGELQQKWAEGKAAKRMARQKYGF